MLTAGGRVVRIRHDPSAGGNKLMVPTEHELKTTLYEQVSDVDSMTNTYYIVGLFQHVGSIVIAVLSSKCLYMNNYLPFHVILERPGARFVTDSER